MVKNKMRPVHPGEILREEYLVPMGMSVHALSQALRVPATRLHEIVKERRSITPDTALRLARYFWHGCTVLAEPATELRFEDRRSGIEGQDRARSRRDGGVAAHDVLPMIISGLSLASSYPNTNISASGINTSAATLPIKTMDATFSGSWE